MVSLKFWTLLTSFQWSIRLQAMKIVVHLIISLNCVQLLSFMIFLLFTRLIWKWTKDNIWKVWSPQGSSATGRNIPIYIRIPWRHSKSLFNIETLSSCGYYGCLLNVTLSEKCAMIIFLHAVYLCELRMCTAAAQGIF